MNTHTIVRHSYPFKTQTARRLGYKTNKNHVIVRVKIKKGNRYRGLPVRGRSVSKYRSKINKSISHMRVAVNKALKKYVNFKKLGVYKISTDAFHQLFQIILCKK